MFSQLPRSGASPTEARLPPAGPWSWALSLQELAMQGITQGWGRITALSLASHPLCQPRGPGASLFRTCDRLPPHVHPDGAGGWGVGQTWNLFGVWDDALTNRATQPGLSCKNLLYILDTSPLSDIWFANIFSYSVGCLFTFLIVVIEVQMFLILAKSNLFIFLLLLVFWVSYLRVHGQMQGHKDLLLCFLLRIFKFYLLTCSLNFFMWRMWVSSFCSIIYWKDPFAQSCHPCWKLIALNKWIYFWTLTTIPVIRMSILVSVSHCLD